MPKFRVSLSFGSMSDGELPPFGGGVITGVTGNASFPDLLVSIPDMTLALNKFTNARSAAEKGGVELTLLKNEAKQELIDVLQMNASYVQGVAGSDLTMLVSSGYQPASKNRVQAPLATPVIERVENVQTTVLGLRVPPVRNARLLEVRVKQGAGPLQVVGTFTSGRSIRVPGLTPGMYYTLEVRALGGLTGSSDWSDAVTHMAT